MENMPNAYRILYEVYEGDNTGGGMVLRTKDVKLDKLGESILNMRRDVKILEVSPIYVEIFAPLRADAINNAINEANAARQEKARLAEINRLEKKLAQLKKI